MLFVNAEILFDNPLLYYQLCAETECHREIIKNCTWHNRADYSDGGESSGEGCVKHNLSVCIWFFFPCAFSTLLPAYVSRSAESHQKKALQEQDRHEALWGHVKQLFHAQCISESKGKERWWCSLKGVLSKTQTQQTIGTSASYVLGLVNWWDRSTASIYRTIKTVIPLWILN